MQVKQPKNIKLKMRGHILRSGVNWYRTLKQNNLKQGFGVISCTSLLPVKTISDVFLELGYRKSLKMMTVSDNNIYLSEQKYITTYITIRSTSVT